MQPQAVVADLSREAEPFEEKISTGAKAEDHIETSTLDDQERRKTGHGNHTEEDSSRVLRKIDWHLMPIMCALYAIQFVGLPATLCARRLVVEHVH